MMTTATADSGSRGLSPGVLILGAVLLLVAFVAAGMLSYSSLSGAELPGCGLNSGCGKVTNSVWGSVPGLGWSTSHVGLTFFAGVLVAWLLTKGALSVPMRWLIRLGGLMSLMFIIVMLSGAGLCWYCITTHLANFAFIGLLEFIARPTPGPEPKPIGAFAATFVVVTGVLFAWQSGTNKAAEEQAKQDADDAIKEMIAQNDDATMTAVR